MIPSALKYNPADILLVFHHQAYRVDDDPDLARIVLPSFYCALRDPTRSFSRAIVFPLFTGLFVRWSEAFLANFSLLPKLLFFLFLLAFFFFLSKSKQIGFPLHPSTPFDIDASPWSPLILCHGGL